MSVPAVHRARHGALCHLVDDCVVGASLTRYGEWAEEELWLLSGAVTPGAVVLDVGANVGTHTVAFSRFVGPSGRVLAFDGQRRAFQLLSANVLLNRCGNVDCHGVLVGDSPSIVMVEEPAPGSPNNMGSTTFRNLRLPDGGETSLSPVSMISIDSLRLRRCDLIKIDVEGMEYDVLRGAVRTIQKCKPVIYFEQAGQDRLPEAVRLLSGLGYSLRWHIAHPFNGANFRGDLVDMFGGARETNVLALHPSRAGLGEVLRFTSLPVVGECRPDVGPSPDDPGWSLPMDAYSLLPPPVVHAPDAESFDCVLSGASAWGGLPASGVAVMQAAFNDLLEDRGKAQQIMEHLSDHIMKLDAELLALRTAEVHRAA